MTQYTHTLLRPAEWVLPGHPDKLADAIADSLVQAAVEREAEALCAIEVAVHRDAVFLTGRLACEGSDQIDLRGLVNEVYRSAGYGDRWRPAPDDIQVLGNLCVDTLVRDEASVRHISDDQSIVTGYAIDLPGLGYLPPEQWIARELALALYRLVDSPMQLCPDGKVLVVMEESPDGENGADWARRLRSVSASLLTPDAVSGVELQRTVVLAIREVLQRAVTLLPGLSAEVPKDILVNGSGNFHMGGPEGDNGLSGKKLLLDYYGPRVPIGGSALSGKDFHKPDRAGAIIARRLALAVVQTGVAEDATVHLASFPGDEAPRILRIATPEGDLREPQRWRHLVDCRFKSIPRQDETVDLVQAARWGHWGHGGPRERLGGEIDGTDRRSQRMASCSPVSSNWDDDSMTKKVPFVRGPEKRRISE